MEKKQDFSFEVFFESSPDALLVVGADGRITHVNRQAEISFQYGRGDLLGENIEVLIPERYRETHVQHRAKYLENPRIRPMGAGLELFGLRKDHTEFPVDIMLSALEGQGSGLTLVVVRNVTERKRQEAALRASTELVEKLVESAPDAIVAIDAQGRILRVNAQAEAMFQYGREELLGRRVEMLLPDRFEEAHVRHRNRYLQQPRVRQMGAGLALFGKRKDGTEFPVDIMLSPLEAEEGVIVLAVVRDITERKLAEEQEKVRSALRQKELLLKEIHHRVKNNLQIVCSLLNLMSQRVSDPQILPMFADIHARVRAMALIHEKLYQSSDQALLNFQEYLLDLASDLARSHSAEERKIRLSVRAEAVSLSIERAIPCALIVNELITNSLKHAFPAGAGGGSMEVTLETRKPGSLSLVVRDDGVGFRHRAESATSNTLGLQIVRTLADQLGGTLQIHSEKGACVEVAFPLGPEGS